MKNKNKNKNAWIVRCLIINGNCYVSKNHDFKVIERMIGKELIYTEVGSGYMISIKKEGDESGSTR